MTNAVFRGASIVQIKVEGTASDEAKALADHEDTLLRTGLDALKDYYAAPNGEDGDARRERADKVIKATGAQVRDIRERRKGLKDIAEEAQDYKGDFLKWIAALQP